MKLRHYNFEDKNKMLIFLPERIDNLNIQDLEESIYTLLDENSIDNVILEASALNYLSSVGIRMFLKMHSKGKQVELIRTTPEVADLLTKVGIDEVIPVFSENKVVFTKNLKVLKESMDFIVYLLEKDKALKVAKNDNHKKDIMDEKNSIREAFLLGIPTLIPYDYVRTTEGRFGLIYELPEAKSFETLILENPDREEEILNYFVDQTKEVHQIIVPKSRYSVSQKENLLESLLERNIIDEEEKSKIESFYSYIPDTKNFLHTHLDFNNIIQTAKEDVLFTHINRLATGHPVLDLYRLYYTYYLLPDADLASYQKQHKLPVEKGRELTDRFIMRYFDIDSKEALDRIYKQLRVLSLIHYLEKKNRHNKNIDEAMNQKIKDALFSELKALELITF